MRARSHASTCLSYSFCTRTRCSIACSFVRVTVYLYRYCEYIQYRRICKVVLEDVREVRLPHSGGIRRLTADAAMYRPCMRPCTRTGARPRPVRHGQPPRNPAGLNGVLSLQLLPGVLR